MYKPNISDLGYILPFINDGNGTFILHTQNNEARFGRFGKFEYIESTKYKKYSRNLITLSFYQSHDLKRLIIHLGVLRLIRSFTSKEDLVRDK